MKDQLIVQNNLKILRKTRGIQQKFIAESIGISANYYCQIENGHRSLPTKYLPKIKEIFGVILSTYQQLICIKLERWCRYGARYT